MSLLTNLKKNNIIVNPSSKGKWELIDELVASAVKYKYIAKENSQNILDSLIEREKSMSTGIGNGVAIPHCTCSNVSEVTAILAILPKGMDFDSIDGKAVQIVVMLIVPQNRLSQHIKTLANIAKLLKNEELRNKLVSLKTPESIIKTLIKYKNQEAK